MLTAATGRPVYLACGPTDLRKSIDALAALVQLTFQRDPCSAALFVFCNRDRTKLKILEWDDAGFWLHYRRLERGRIQWPARGAAATTWAASDSITEVAGDLLRPLPGFRSVKLVSHFVSNEDAHQKERDKVPYLLYQEIRKTFGWPIGLSYAIRNHLVHDGGQSSRAHFFEDGPGSTAAFRISHPGWDFVCDKARAYGVADSGFSRMNDWPVVPTDDFRVLMDVCIREMDDALGVLLGYACAALRTNAAFMLKED